MKQFFQGLEFWDSVVICRVTTNSFTLYPSSGNWNVYWSLARGPAEVASGEDLFQDPSVIDSSKFHKSSHFNGLVTL
jgi:hypothetical protein